MSFALKRTMKMFITMGIVSSGTLRRRSRASGIFSPKPELGTEDSPGWQLNSDKPSSGGSVGMHERSHENEQFSL